MDNKVVNSKVKNSKLKIVNSDSAYVGPERRVDRRREKGHDRVERLLINFGLDRRLSNDRRRKDTSWFLTSSKVVNM